MSIKGPPQTPPGSGENPKGKGITSDEGDRRNLTLTAVDTVKMLGGLNALFETVMSGREYDFQQVKNATGLTNTMIKVLRFEFDVYKHFSQEGRSLNFVDEEPSPNRVKPRSGAPS